MLLAFIANSFLSFFVPDSYQGLVGSLFLYAWVFYLCQWIRRIDPHAKCLIWSYSYIGTALTIDAVDIWTLPPKFASVLNLLLYVAVFVVSIATIFTIKADLERHYNKREPIGLVLSGGMTFFFSFLYFQAHLYRIASQKQAESHPSFGPSLP
jgi:hypothetical protein